MQPRNTNPITFSQQLAAGPDFCTGRPDRFDGPYDLMARHKRKVGRMDVSFNRVQIGVANPTIPHPHQHLTGTRCWHRNVNQAELRLFGLALPG
jgi:hypothetical protein